jgi:hypothetical protein
VGERGGNKPLYPEEIDTTDLSFNIDIDLNQITYGRFIVTFTQDFDSTSLLRYRSRRASEVLTKLKGSKYSEL